MNEPTTLYQLQNSGPAADFNTVMRRLAGGSNDPTLSPMASIAENVGELIQRAKLTPAERAARAARVAAGEAARKAQQRALEGPLPVGTFGGDA